MAAPTVNPRRRSARPWVGAGALLSAAILLAACGGGGSSGASASNSKLISADAAALRDLAHYQSAVTACGSAIACIESADRTAGNQIHLYANTLGAVSEGKDSTQAASTALGAAQTLANSLEILGDAQPTKANYDRVLGSFDLHKAIDTLTSDINDVNGAYST